MYLSPEAKLISFESFADEVLPDENMGGGSNDD